MKVDIPFRGKFQNLMLSGKKTCTSRYAPYGRRGDYFEAFGAVFSITKVFRARVRHVARFYFRDEGFRTGSDFLRNWREIYPVKNDLDELVYVHFFKRGRYLW